MLIKRSDDIRSSEITPESVYHNRREFIVKAAAAGMAIAAGSIFPDQLFGQDRWPQGKKGPYDTDELVNTFKEITTYNNYYEFGTDKSDPSENAGSLRTKPWTVKVEGECKKPGSYNLEDFVKAYKMEDRVCRHRCVEGWSMVIPWHGFPMADMIKKLEPTSKAKYVEFTSLADPNQMPGVKRPYLNWPYREGLRMDEALTPLAFMATGLYGKDLPNQNGAPLRSVIPWKYGFKCCKSIVRIRFTETQPSTTWNEAAPDEYGFYSNVNPNVDHPRWSQKTEKRLPSSIFKPHVIPTQMFNGYGEQVASLYAGMDLKKNF